MNPLTIIIALILGGICAFINKQKGYSPVVGFLAGLLLGPIGLILVIFSKSK